MRLKIIFSFITLITSLVCCSQQKKFEQEKSLRKKEVPKPIITLLSPYFPQAKRINFYQETDGEHESIEIKFFLDKKKYSVEFTKNGKLEDVEIIISKDEVAEEAIGGIETILSKYDKYKIDKIQQQVSSETSSDVDVIEKALNEQDGDIIRYELEVELKQNGIWKPFEMLFDDDGKLLLKRGIAKRASDFILYR